MDGGRSCVVLIPAIVQDHGSRVTAERAAHSVLQCVPQPAPGSFDAGNSRSPPVFAAADPATLPPSVAPRQAVALPEPRQRQHPARLPVPAARLAVAGVCAPAVPVRCPAWHLPFLLFHAAPCCQRPATQEQFPPQPAISPPPKPKPEFI